MTIVLMWCRSRDDNIIGIGSEIPWDEPEDKDNYAKVVADEVVVMGRKTYEAMGEEFLNKHKIFVMSNNCDYEVINHNLHKVINKQSDLKDVEDDLYISGGSYIYEIFLKGKEGFKPHIIVDCVYEGDVLELVGEKIDVTCCMEVIKNGYRRITPFYKKGNVKSAIWIKKGDFVEQGVLKKIVKILENGAEIF